MRLHGKPFREDQLRSATRGQIWPGGLLKDVYSNSIAARCWSARLNLHRKGKGHM